MEKLLLLLLGMCLFCCSCNNREAVNQTAEGKIISANSEQNKIIAGTDSEKKSHFAEIAERSDILWKRM